MRPQVTADGHAKMFVMNDEEQAAEYNAILDRAAKNEVAILKEEVVWSEHYLSFVVYARWQSIFQQFTDELLSSFSGGYPNAMVFSDRG